MNDSNNREHNHIVTYCLLASLAFHALLYLASPLLKGPSYPAASQPIEVKYVDQKPSRQIVEDDSVKTKNQKIHDAVKRLSKLTKRVEQEIAALKTGATKNRGGSKKQTSKTQLPKKQPKNGVGRFAPDRPTAGSMGVFGSSPGTSTINDYIPDIKRGYFTALNTDQLSYYTFYERMNSQIRPRWGMAVRNFFMSLSMKQKRKVAAKVRKTSVQIHLNKKGHVTKAFIVNSSGVKSLDNGPLKAFIGSSPFLNPPIEMTNDEGEIILNYMFVLDFRPSYYTQGGS